MTFIARLLRFLFWVVVLTWAMSLLRRLVSRMQAGGLGEKRDIDLPSDSFREKLVRDPVCGMHIARTLALTVKQDGETVHFCSPECRDKYLGNTQKFAANG